MLSLDVYLTPTVRASAMDAIKHGVPAHQALTRCGVPVRTVYGWMQAATSQHWSDGTPISPEAQVALAALADEIATARSEFEANAVEAIHQDAESVNSKTGQRDWRARAWLLNNLPHTRQTYHEYRETHITGQQTVSHEHRYIAELPAAEALQLASPSILELLDS